ncbi:MAG: sulfatase [Bacteroidetes bacterium]|nr:sulfatase [Bacteroidota bacterium]
MKKIFLALLCLTTVVLVGQTKCKTQNLIIITLDGLRWQEVFTGADSSFIHNGKLVGDANACSKKYWNDNIEERREMLMPFIWRTLVKQGQIYGNRNKGCYENVKNPYWFSYPGYNEIFTGFADEKVNSNEYGPNPNINVLEAMNQTSEFKGKIAVFTSWNAFHDILNEKRSGLSVNAGIERQQGMDNDAVMQNLNEIQYQLPDIFEGVRLDGVTFNMGFKYLKIRKPHVLYLGFDETDDFAHASRYFDYLNSAHYEDDMIGMIWKWVQSDPQYRDKTTLFITCDHGRGVDAEGWKSHGSKIPNSNETWFAIIGPDTPPLGEIKEGQYYNNQFAKTWAALLGFNFETPNPVGDAITNVIGK